jgi:hypothetical protein
MASRTIAVIRRIFGWLLAVITFLFIAAKTATDWIGRTTVLDDAKVLGERAYAMTLFLSEQPTFWFYAVCALLFVLGVCLLVPRETFLDWWAKFRRDHTAPTKAKDVNITSFAQSGGVTAHTVHTFDQRDENAEQRE